MARWNFLAFRPLPVIILTTTTYIALFAGLLTIHHNVPELPSSTPKGINLTQAWSDLERITGHFHPYNSHANDNVRAYLLARVKQIIASKDIDKEKVQVFDDNVANATFASGRTTVYFEGTNIIVAIRGSQDEEPYFPEAQPLTARPRSARNGGILVNAHYDSVSTGYGATDDGVGVVTILQLLSYFTEPQHWPQRTVILLLNNGEEDYLNGARVFMRNPISQVPHVFLNLEGAGAGGRAVMFRSTDTEVTRPYKHAKHPFGSVISADGFKRRVIASQTDYVVFNGELGLRGLDVAFMEPRGRYHTAEDSTRETSLKSVWHMLDAAIATTSGLAGDTSNDFSGSGRSSTDGKVDAGHGTEAVWFDLFGKTFVVFRLHTLFALNVTLLVVAPIVLIGLTAALSKADKNYLFARKRYVHSSDDDAPIQLNGWRGFSRFPLAFATATAVDIVLAYLMTKTNPYIVHSSPYAVWSTILSAWLFVAWFLLRGADAMRPSALTRMYALIWLFAGAFVLLIAVTILAKDYNIAGGYFIMFYFAAAFFALLISYVELFFAPSKDAFVREAEDKASSRRGSGGPNRPMSGTATASDDRNDIEDDATETTSLLRGDRRSFARRRESTSEGTTHEGPLTPSISRNVYSGEQGWSGSLPTSLWLLQFLILVPFSTILVGQIALLLTSALHQTAQDGGSSLLIYIAFAAFGTLLLAPIGPFLHRFTYHVPTFLFFLCIGSLIYNLVAFPFSRDHRLKLYFVQQVDLNTGENLVSLTGPDKFVQQAVAQIPSAQGQDVNCTSPEVEVRKKLRKCAWKGLPARVVPTSTAQHHNRTYLDTWLDYEVIENKHANHASIRVLGQNTRACRIIFDSAISDLMVEGGVSDARFNMTGEGGTHELRLWHREWSQPWNVSVTWDDDMNSKHSGSIVCLWSDANAGAIPAFDEVQHFLPKWAVATKYSDGLVEGAKRWST